MIIKYEELSKLKESTSEIDFLYQEGVVFSDYEASMLENVSKHLHEVSMGILDDNYRRTHKGA